MTVPAFHVPSVALRFSVNNFFDRQAVRDALTDMDRRALMKAGSRVRDRAKEGIKKRGLARPRLRIMRENEGAPLRSLLKLPGVPASVSGSIKRRIIEIKTKPPSKPGTPPHTHVPTGHMLGFRRNLYFSYDSSTRSVVVGPSRKGKMLPYLHEFGGSQDLQAWEWRNKYPLKWNDRQRLIAATLHPSQWRQAAGDMAPPAYLLWLSPGDAPRNASKWGPTGIKSRTRYPARPFMLPGLRKAISRGDLQRAFQGAFRAAAHGRGVMIRRP